MAYSNPCFRLAALALGSIPATALAGPPEVLNGVVVHPTDPSVMVLRYENALGGLFYSGDGGRSWRIRPGLTFTRDGLREDTSLAFAGDALLVGSSDGLAKTDRAGCATSNPISNAFVDAVASDPSDPSVGYFVTSQASNGGRVGLWQRDARGAITPLGESDEDALHVSSMLVVNGRFVQTATRRSDGGTGAVLRISDDRGKSWQERAIPGEGTPRVLAVDRGRVLVALVRNKATDAILYTSDDGVTWQTYLDGVQQVGQAAVAPDGRLWLSDMGDPTLTTKTGGLWFATRIGEPLERVLDEVGVTCLAHDRARDRLWLCQDYELDTFDPRTRGLCRVFALTDLASFVECADEDLSTSARAQQQLCGGYCGSLHFAEAPLCELYDDPYGLCGAPARYFDEKAGWVDPAGPRERCEPLAMPPVDAGFDAGSVADAGSNAIDAGKRNERDSDGCALGSEGGFGAALLAWMLALRRRRSPAA